MLLGSLLHCGLPQDFLLNELAKLQLPGLDLTIRTKSVNAISALHIKVDSSRRQELRTLPDISAILEKSNLSTQITEKALAVFRALAVAEAKIHNVDVDSVHFHEVGAIDTIVDIVGIIIGLDFFGVKRLFCSPLPMSRGFVQCAHGMLPLPAPAVCELLKNIPTYGTEQQQEMVTPTGAAIISVLADAFGQFPPMTISTVGYGAGTHELTGNHPNLLRLFIGETQEVAESQQVEVIETNMDDWSPEGFPYLSELLFAAGALDVSINSIHMKTGRPGFCLQVIATPVTAQELKEIILTETSAIGLRYRHENRLTLPRRMVEVPTPWGNVTAKHIDTPAGPVVRPEYEECRKISIAHKISLQSVYDAIRHNQPTTDE